MADYYPLISRAVAGLERNTGENRRSLYERARNALLDQLRNVTPALSETDITRERLALEEAIRKVEADVARRMREEIPRPAERSFQRMRDTLRPDQVAREPAADGDVPPAPPPPSPESRPAFSRIVGRPEVTAADLRRFPRRPPPPEPKPPEPRPAELRTPEFKAPSSKRPSPKRPSSKHPSSKRPSSKRPSPRRRSSRRRSRRSPRSRARPRSRAPLCLSRCTPHRPLTCSRRSHRLRRRSCPRRSRRPALTDRHPRLTGRRPGLTGRRRD